MTLCTNSQQFAFEWTARPVAGFVKLFDWIVVLCTCSHGYWLLHCAPDHCVCVRACVRARALVCVGVCVEVSF